MIAQNLPRQFGDQMGFAQIPALVAFIEPVPALVGVGGRGLLRIRDQERLLVGEVVHAGAGGEVVRRLRAAMKHDD